MCSYELHLGCRAACTASQGEFLRGKLMELGLTKAQISAMMD